MSTVKGEGAGVNVVVPSDPLQSSRTLARDFLARGDELLKCRSLTCYSY